MRVMSSAYDKTPIKLPLIWQPTPDCFNFCNNGSIYRQKKIRLEQAARMLKRIPWRNHVTPVLSELHWLKIHDRIIF